MIRSILIGAFLLGTLAACGGNVLQEAEAKSKAACECKDADCVRPHIKWFNMMELKDGGAALKGLSKEEHAKYKALSSAAGTCQVNIKNGKK